MSVQLSYVKNIRTTLAGLLAVVGSPADILSRIVEEVTGIPYGTAVGRGTDEGIQVVLGIGAGYLGVAIRDSALENATVGSEDEQYVDKKQIAIIRSGYIWVALEVGQTPAIGGAVFFDEVTGLFSTADAASRSQIDDATFESVNNSDLAIIHLSSTSSTTAGA